MPDFSPEKFVIFLLAIVPGFFTMQVYSLWYPSQRKDWGSSLIEIVCYSLLTHLFWGAWVVHHLKVHGVVTADGEFLGQKLLADPSVLQLPIFLICFLTPVVLASIIYGLRRWVLPSLGMDHPTRTAWDYALKKNRWALVLCTLKTGERVGGLFAGESYSATYPVEPELYIEELWVIEEGGFVRPIEGSRGTVVRVADCKLIEFFEARTEGLPSRPFWKRYLFLLLKEIRRVGRRCKDARRARAAHPVRADRKADQSDPGSAGGVRGEGASGNAGAGGREEDYPTPGKVCVARSCPASATSSAAAGE